MSVDTPCKTEDPTIVNLRDCSQGFHFCAIFHVANVMVCYQTAVLFHVWLFNLSQWGWAGWLNLVADFVSNCFVHTILYTESVNNSGLFGGFGDPVEVTLRRFLPS